MELEDSEIINLAVSIFQNVGIKRYIGHIEALQHEDIYFEIYKIIFPDSMINIFKISESKLTTGQKIQKIIEEISFIIKLDLYHISGQEIARGNRTHLTNWLQLLEALSNNYVSYQTYNPGGSAPDRDRDIEKEFDDNDYHTVIGIKRQFDKHYTEVGKSSNNSSQYGEDSESDNPPEHTTQSSQPSVSVSKHSSVSHETLQPKNGKIKTGKGKKKQKRVTFKVDEASSQSQKIQKNRTPIHSSKSLRTSNSTNLTSNTILKTYGQSSPFRLSKQQKILRKKRNFIEKMYKIEEQMERKKISDEVLKFEKWANESNYEHQKQQQKINFQNKERIKLINKKLIEREQVVKSLSGQRQAYYQIKHLFQKQKQDERRLRKAMQERERKETLMVMDTKFAAQFENLVMASLAE